MLSIASEPWRLWVCGEACGDSLVPPPGQEPTLMTAQVGVPIVQKTNSCSGRFFWQFLAGVRTILSQDNNFYFINKIVRLTNPFRSNCRPRLLIARILQSNLQTNKNQPKSPNNIFSYIHITQIYVSIEGKDE